MGEKLLGNRRYFGAAHANSESSSQPMPADAVAVLEPVKVGINLLQINVTGELLDEHVIVTEEGGRNQANQEGQRNGMAIEALPEELGRES